MARPAGWQVFAYQVGWFNQRRSAHAGLIIFAVGLYLVNLAAKIIRTTGAAQAGQLSLAARVSILVLAGAMALRQMGLANEIVNMAFGLLLRAIAVAVMSIQIVLNDDNDISRWEEFVNQVAHCVGIVDL